MDSRTGEKRRKAAKIAQNLARRKIVAVVLSSQNGLKVILIRFSRYLKYLRSGFPSFTQALESNPALLSPAPLL